MRTVHDGLYRAETTQSPLAAIYHLRIYTSAPAADTPEPAHDTTPGPEQDHQTVAILGELGDNPGPSITNAWEGVIEALTRHIHGLAGTWPITFFEHYPPDEDRHGWGSIVGTFDLVTFQAGTAHWEPSSQGLIENLIIGQPVQTWPRADYQARSLILR